MFAVIGNIVLFGRKAWLDLSEFCPSAAAGVLPRHEVTFEVPPDS